MTVEGWLNRLNALCCRKVSDELFQRTVSLFLLIPMGMLVVLLSERGFQVLCWFAYLIIGFEIFSPAIRGKLLLRTGMLIFCFFGIQAFMYCRRFFGPFGCLLLICISSFSDMGGYFFGKTFGGPKLCPKISPNKTWAGFLGCIISANVVLFLLKDFVFVTENGASVLYSNPSNFFGMQILILSTVAGDLLESTFKRKIGVKDMGKLFPGHGGFLDRLDSLLMESIVFVILDTLL